MMRKLISLLLMLSLVSIIFPVDALEEKTASDVIPTLATYKSEWFKEQASEYLVDILNCIKTNWNDYGYAEDELDKIEVKGPFVVIDADLKQNDTVNYFLSVDNNVKGIVHMYLKDDTMVVEYGRDYAVQINSLITAGKDFILYRTTHGVYAQNENKTISTIVDISELIGDVNHDEYSAEKIINEMSSSFDLFEYSVSIDDFTYPSTDNIITSNNANDSGKSTATITSAPPTPPLVIQYEGSNHKQMWCHNAVVASVAQAREPSLYAGLTAGQVCDATKTNYLIDASYGRARKISENLTYYLTSAQGHYNSYSSATITKDQYINNINAGHYVLAVAIPDLSPTSYHATVMYNYFYGSSNNFYVNMMDPYNASVDPISYRIC